MSNISALEGLRPHRVFLGVKIYRVKDEIPNLYEMKDGTIKERKPFYEVSYQYADSYPYSTLEECKAAIRNIFDRVVFGDKGKPEFIEVMNNHYTQY